jgi:hypothetical protein
MEESLSPRAAGSPVTEFRIVPKCLFLVPLAALTLAGPTQAGLFKKSAKPDPTIQVPALIETLKADRDEKARIAAATDLDEFDAKAFPDVLPALMDALASDPSPSVRSRAAESIGKVRPISAAAGYALERAVADDKSLAVRVSARAALIKYKVLGHIPGTKIDMVVQSSEPPLAAGPLVKDLGSGTVVRPTPAPAPPTGVALPPLPPIPAPKLPPDGAPDVQTVKPAEQPQTGEPPLADGRKPPTAVPAAAPKAPAPVIVIPSPPAKEAVTPVPTTPTGPTLPPPSPATGPTIPPKE